LFNKKFILALKLIYSLTPSLNGHYHKRRVDSFNYRECLYLTLFIWNRWKLTSHPTLDAL